VPCEPSVRTIYGTMERKHTLKAGTGSSKVSIDQCLQGVFFDHVKAILVESHRQNPDQSKWGMRS
jgi:hypothetical protein